MVSKDYQDLMDLLFKKHQRIKEITVSFKGGETKHTDISFMGNTDTFSSNETDVGDYALHLKHTIDSDGNFDFVAYKDLNQYFRDVEFLFKDEQPKLNRAYHQLIGGQYTFDFDPDELIETFLLSHDRSSIKYSKLKSEHFQIAAYCMNAAAHALQKYEELKSKTPGLESYHQAIDRVYRKAFRSDLLMDNMNDR